MSKLIKLQKEYQLKAKYKKDWNKLKIQFPNTEALTFDIYIKQQEEILAEKYIYYLFKSKNKPILTAKSKYWLKPKYNKNVKKIRNN